MLTWILAGCGGSGEGNSTQVLSGNGFSFAAPADWKVQRKARELAAAGREPELVSVSVFRLARPYRPEMFAKVVPELDRVAGDLAKGLGGGVVSSKTVGVVGRKARQYEIRYAGRVQVTTFVLSGRTEYQLLCRRTVDGDAAACGRLVSSFRLA